MLAISRTPAFRYFQAAVGNATFHINTIVVGFELVAGGGGKPQGLNINWTPPKEPRHSVEQTKQFVLLAILANVVDSFDVLLRSYADLDWLGLAPPLSDRLRKSVTKPSGGEYSIAERTEDLLLHLGIAERDTLSLLALTVAWRNLLVHVGRAKARLPEGIEDSLKAGASRLVARFAGIDIARMLGSFSKGHRPTLKEATTMIAASQNLARTLDQALIRNAAGKPDQIIKIARDALARVFREEEVQWKSVWGRDSAARTRALLSFLAQLGITETNAPISAVLESNEIQKIVLSPRHKIAAVGLVDGS